MEKYIKSKKENKNTRLVINHGISPPLARKTFKSLKISQELNRPLSEHFRNNLSSKGKMVCD